MFACTIGSLMADVPEPVALQCALAAGAGCFEAGLRQLMRPLLLRFVSSRYAPIGTAATALVSYSLASIVRCRLSEKLNAHYNVVYDPNARGSRWEPQLQKIGNLLVSSPLCGTREDLCVLAFRTILLP